MTRTADAVIIGCGVNGASVAFQLAKRGLKVIILEKHLIASGGTGRSAAIIRQHYSNEELARMAKRSTEVFHHFDDLVGGDPGFVNTGWVFLTPEYVSDGFAENLAMLRKVGIETREISKEELRTIEPRMDLSDVHRIAYEPASGYADPYATTCCYLRRCIEMGGELLQMTRARGLVIQGEKVKGVKTAQGEISTGVVVNAAGPWARELGGWANLDIPIKVTREHEIVLEAVHVGGPPTLVFSDMSKAIYCRPQGRSRILLGRGFPKDYEIVDPVHNTADLDHHKEGVYRDFIEDAGNRLFARVPALTGALFLNAFTGLYDVTPDWHPILGRVDSIDGFYMCAGFSGHGFKIAPAIGELVAEEIVEGKARSIDLTRFTLSRFARKELFTAAYGGNRA